MTTTTTFIFPNARSDKSQSFIIVNPDPRISGAQYNKELNKIQETMNSTTLAVQSLASGTTTPAVVMNTNEQINKIQETINSATLALQSLASSTAVLAAPVPVMNINEQAQQQLNAIKQDQPAMHSPTPVQPNAQQQEIVETAQALQQMAIDNGYTNVKDFMQVLYQLNQQHKQVLDEQDKVSREVLDDDKHGIPALLAAHDTPKVEAEAFLKTLNDHRHSFPHVLRGVLSTAARNGTAVQLQQEVTQSQMQVIKEQKETIQEQKEANKKLQEKNVELEQIIANSKPPTILATGKEDRISSASAIYESALQKRKATTSTIELPLNSNVKKQQVMTDAEMLRTTLR
jgi:hypothetical protein